MALLMSRARAPNDNKTTRTIATVTATAPLVSRITGSRQTTFPLFLAGSALFMSHHRLSCEVDRRCNRSESWQHRIGIGESQRDLHRCACGASSHDITGHIPSRNTGSRQISVDRSIDLTSSNRRYRLNNTQPCPFSTGIGQYRLAIESHAELDNPKQDHHEHRQQQGELDRRGPRFRPPCVLYAPHHPTFRYLD